FGNDSNIALFKDESGHDADFGLPRGDDPRTVRTDQGTVHILYIIIGLDHVRDRNALGNGDDHLDSRTGRLHDGISGKCRGNEYYGGVSPHFLYRFLHSVEHRSVQVFLASLSRGHPTHYIGTVLNHLLGVEGTFTARKSLYNNFGILVY